MLTPRQIDVLRAMDALTRQKGYPPTSVEIGREVGLSRQRVHQHIDRLEQLQRVSKEHGHNRSVRVVDINQGSSVID